MVNFFGYDNMSELIRKELLLDKAVQSSPLAYLIVDNRTDKILYFNKKFCEIWKLENLEEKIRIGDLKSNDIMPHCLSLVSDKSSFIESYKLLQSGNNRQVVEDEIKFYDGTIIRRFICQIRDNNDTYIGQLYIFEDITYRKKNELELIRNVNHIARYDYLTNIPNRYYFEEFLSKINKDSSDSALLIVNIDDFKKINDSFGHSEGDKILKKICNLLKANLCNGDFFARLQGDEFAILLYNTNIKSAEIFANKLLKTINMEPFFIENFNIPIKITASIGITKLDKDIEIKQLFYYADAALYEAKEKGKNRVVVLNDTNDKARILQNYHILNLIYEAFKYNRFVLYFQPIYKTRNQLLHYEALIRMYDETNNVIAPGTFIPVAERYGLMMEIDQWVIENTLKILNNIKDLNVFINLSGFSLSNDEFLDWIENTIIKCGVNPNRIGFEITETSAIKNLEKTKRWVYRLKSLGCYFALDDFGVGFSSFSYLHMLPVDYLKIDGSFIRNLDSDPTKLALVKAMNVVAHTLGKKTIAEYVENEAIWNMLHELGTDCGQGYFLGKPNPIY